MAFQNPTYIGDMCYTPDNLRQAWGGLVCGEGVGATGDLQVTEDSPAGASVVIAPGHLWVNNDQDTGAGEGGYYHVYNDAPLVVAVPNNATGVTRTDTLWVEVCDSQYAASSSVGTAYQVGTVSPPAGACTYYLLATIAVPTTTVVTNAVITDERDVFTACSSGGALRDVLTFTTSGSFDKADFAPWLKSVKVKVQGGGGGSAGTGTAGAAPNNSAMGSGGGGGGYSEKVWRVDELPSGPITVTVGAAGAAGTSGGNGGDGGASSFNGIVGSGGLGGNPSGPGPTTGNSTNNSPGVVGGAASGGDLNIPGTGSEAINVIGGGNGFRYFGGSGGESHMAPGRKRGSFGPSAGTVGSFPGGGAAGSAAENGNNVGAAGGAGVVIIELYG